MQRIVGDERNQICVRCTNKERMWFRFIDSDAEFGASHPTNFVRMQWFKRWVFIIQPDGRGFVYEIYGNKVIWSSIFECPVNTSAFLVLSAGEENEALALFGTCESKVYVNRITFSSESFSILPVSSWQCQGAVSSLAAYFSSSKHSKVLVSYSSCSGVGIMNPFSFVLNSPTSKQRTLMSRVNNDFMVENLIFSNTGESTITVLAACNGRIIATLSIGGVLSWYNESFCDQPTNTVYLGFDTIGMKNYPDDTVCDIIVCGWRGEIALVNLDSGEIAKYGRTRELVRVDDFVVYTSPVTNKLLLVQTDADDGGATWSRFDLGRAVLTGTSGNSVDEIAFLGCEIPQHASKEQHERAKQFMKTSWDLLLQEEEVNFVPLFGQKQ